MTNFIDFATLARPNKPNTYLLAPEGICSANTDGAAPEFKLPAQDLFERIYSNLEKSSSVRRLKTDPKTLQIKYVDVTKLMKYKDDIDIAVMEANGGSTVAIYSRSRLGHSDLGKNRKRVEALMNSLSGA